MSLCNRLPACELTKAYVVASAILNLQMENYKKEFQFQTFNNQHTCGNGPKIVEQRKQD